jgi:hypothetical protein
MKMKLQDMAAESLSSTIVQRMNRNTAGTFLNTLNKITTENAPTDTRWNIFMIDESGFKINNKPGAVITENGSKNVHVLTSGGKSENITVIACCNAPEHILSPSNFQVGQQEGGIW